MALKKTQADGEAEIIVDDKNKAAKKKKAYAEPNLMVYGTVRGMTATGTGKQQEAANTGGQSNPNDPGKRP